MYLETFKFGEGPNLVFLAGANADYYYYEKFLELLAKRYTVYFFNYPGFGGSERMPGSLSLEAYCDVIEEFLKQNKLKDIYLAGTSFGGLLAIHFTHSRQDKYVKKLILLTPMTRLFSTSLVGNGMRILRSRRQRLKEGESPLIADTLHIHHLKRFWNKITHSRFVVSCGLDGKHIPATVPILLVTGGKDLLVDCDYTLKIFSNKNNVEILHIPHAGHDAFATMGNKVLDVIWKFTSTSNK